MKTGIRFPRILFGLTLALFLGTSISSRAQVAAPNLKVGIPLGAPTQTLEEVLAGTKRAVVRHLDRQGLSLFLNSETQGVTIEGWSTKVLNDAEADALFKQFGVTVTWDQAKGTSQFLFPPDVGRAGVLEGDTFFKLNGKVFKGLTLKGYGGNPKHYMGEQPAGSMDLAESFRDMEVSKILTESKVDTYIGALIVERPGAKANYIRLSRTALRMDAITKMTDPAKLTRLVDYFTDLMQEEMGRKLNFAEFNEWIISHTADIMARKDYLRFYHGSITVDNLGIGELVDLGDTWNEAGLKLPGEYNSQNTKYKNIVWQAEQKLFAAEKGISEAQVGKTMKAEFDKAYDEAYGKRLQALQEFDRNRINLNTATVDDLTQIGFSQTEAQAIVKLSSDTPDGILDPRELESIKALGKNIDLILEKTTTDFMKLADASQLSKYYVDRVGGTDGVREIMAKTRDYMAQNQIKVTRDAKGNVELTPEVQKLKGEIGKLALEKAKALGFKEVLQGESVTRFSKFIAMQTLEVLAKR